MAQIGNNILISGLSGKLIIRWVRASNTLAEVGRSIAFNFPVDMVYTIPNLAPVVYIVQFWRSDDGTALSQLIKDWGIDASQQTTTTTRTFQYKVDRGWNNTTPVSTGTEVWADPSDAQIVLVDERLDGFVKLNLLVHEQGVGNKLDEEYDLHLGGGIELLGGKTFDSQVAWFITVFETQTTTIGGGDDSSGGDLFSDVIEVLSTRDLYVDSVDNLYNKLVVIEGDGPVVQINMRNLLLIPDGIHVLFNTHYGNHNYMTLQFDVGNTFKFMNKELNVAHFVKGEEIWLYFKGSKCRVIKYNGNYFKRGSILFDYDITRGTDFGNLIEADEATGVLTKADLPGLYEFVASLSGTAVCNLGSGVGQWSYANAGVFENKTKFGIDTGTLTFRVPHLTGMVAKITATPGVYEAAQVGEINESFAFKQGKSDDNESGVTGEYLRKPGASGGSNYGNTNVVFLFNATKENKVKNFSQKTYIHL